MSNIQPAVLTIAGSDSGGGAGIQADLRTFNCFKVYGCSAITAVTSQNPDEVRRVDILPAEAVKAQLESVLDIIPVRFAKSGMLANQKIVQTVAQLVQKYDLQLIVDPVMVSTSGTRLLEDSAVESMQKLLFPLAAWITPNIPEAELICSRKLSNWQELADAALQLYELYKCSVLLKSGHAITSGEVTDIVCWQGKLFALKSPRAEVSGNTTHGSGCTLSAALAANLALGKNWQEALKVAKAFVYGSLCGSVNLSDTLSQMYPPEINCFNQVSLIEL